MVRYASFSIPGASFVGLTNGSNYWVDRGGRLSGPTSGTLLPPEFYDFDTCQIVKFYAGALGAQTGAAGMTFNLVELWPGGPGAPIGLPGASQNFVANIDTWSGPFGGAFGGVWNITEYQGWFASGGGVKNTIYRGGLVGLQVFATTWPTAGSTVNVDIWGIKDATFPRH